MLLWLGAPLSALLFILVAFAVVAACRPLLWKHVGDDTRTLSGTVLVRLGSLHALILALVFAQEQYNYLAVESTIREEVAAVADVYYGLKRLDAERTKPVQRHVAAYVEAVITEDWPRLAQGALSENSWAEYIAVDEALFSLETTSEREARILPELLRDWDIISELRRARETAARRSLPAIFWVLAVLGFILVTVPFYVFEPRPPNLFLLAIFATYNGLALYFVLGLSSPFSGVSAIGPGVFESLFLEDMVQLLEAHLVS